MPFKMERSKMSSRSSVSRRSMPMSPKEKTTPVSYVRVRFIEFSLDDIYQPSPIKLQSPHQTSPGKFIPSIPEREIMININCPIRLLMEYVRNEANIPESADFDLFDEMGNLKRTFEITAQTTASKILLPKAIYFIVLLPKNEQGLPLKQQLLINRGARVNGDYTTRIRRQLFSAKKYGTASART